MAHPHRLIWLAAALFLVLGLAGCKKDDDSGGDEGKEEEEEVDISHEAICEHVNGLMKEEGKDEMPEGECPELMKKMQDDIGDDWEEFATCVVKSDNVDATEKCFKEIVVGANPESDDATWSPNSVCMKMKELSPNMGGDCRSDMRGLKKMITPKEWEAFSTCMMDASDPQTAEGCFVLLPE